MEPKEDSLTFREADRRYADLKRKQETGEIELDAFEAKLRDMMVQDDDGRWWAKSRSTGEWHFHDGSRFVKGTPPGYEQDHDTTAPPEENNTKAGQRAQPADQVGAQPSPPIYVKHWWALALGGLALVVVGALIALTGSFFFGSYVLSCSLLIANGVFAIVASRKADRRLLLLPQGIISGVAGLLALLTYASGLLEASFYTLILWAFCLGIAQITGAYRLRQKSRALWLMMTSGASLVTYGFYVFAVTRSVFTWSPWFESIWPLAAGVLIVILAFQIRDRSKSAAGE